MEPEESATSAGETRRQFLTYAGTAAGSLLVGAFTAAPSPTARKNGGRQSHDADHESLG
jgi:hypothetical protein